MMAQVYMLKNKLENIPKSVLNNIDKMGLDESLTLTELEGEYFNAISNIDKKEFDFCEKKIAFLTGNVGSIKSNKKAFFLTERLRTNYNDTVWFGFLYIFDTVQKKESGGYDAAIVSSNKKRLSTEKVMKRVIQLYSQEKSKCDYEKELAAGMFVWNPSPPGDYFQQYNLFLEEVENILLNDSCMNRIESKVFIIEFWVNEDGTTIEHKIINGFNKALDDKILELAKTIRFENPTKEYYGRDIKGTCLYFQVNFKKNKVKRVGGFW